MKVTPLVALLALLPVAARGQDAGVPVAVRSATLRPADAPELDVGPGVFLPDPVAVASANELAACRAKPADPPPRPPVEPEPSTATGVMVGLAIGLVLGAVGAGLLVVATR